ncbi:unnamed protein product [Diatraea saccharalis]|uniref:Uncharacterized protein n=1 Tax=Diatraea saccharalis TaxID=40085 RepID=A0A9P0C3P8_9NEOP|nr:unnamed protein product [Diatraea saccharalis]
MENLDQKHFTNNLTEAMNGHPINSDTGTTEKHENRLKNNIHNYQIFSDCSYLKNLNNLNDFRPVLDPLQYLQEQIITDYNDNNYIMNHFEDDIWNGLILRVYFQQIFSVPLYSKYRDNENVLVPKVFKWNNIFNYYAIEKMFLLFVSAKVIGSVSKCLDCEVANTKRNIPASTPESNIYILTIDVPDFREAFDCFQENENVIKIIEQQSLQNTVNQKFNQPIALDIETLDNYSLYEFSFCYFKKGKDIIFIENSLIKFLQILLDFAPSKKYKVISNSDERTVSPIHNNWFIQDFLHGFLLASLQRRCKINTLYYISKRYFVIINRHISKVIIEVKMFKLNIFNIYNNNLYQKICNLKSDAKTTYDARIAIYNDISIKEVISISFILNVYNSKLISPLVVKINSINGYQPMHNDENTKVNEVFSNCETCEKREFLLKSESDSERMKTAEVEQIVSEIRTLTLCESIKSIKSENLIYETKSLSDSASINTVGTDEFLHGSISISPCESIKTLESDDHIEELKLISEIESLKNILSKSSTFSLPKINESMCLKCVNNSETDKIYSKTQRRKSDSDKLIDNIYKKNVTIYNDNYLHSKYWLKKLFKGPENNKQVENQNGLLCCRQTEERIINKLYRNVISLKNDMFHKYQQNYSQTLSDFYGKNQLTLRSQYGSFCKYLGQSLVQIFCNVIL